MRMKHQSPEQHAVNGVRAYQWLIITAERKTGDLAWIGAVPYLRGELMKMWRDLYHIRNPIPPAMHEGVLFLADEELRHATDLRADFVAFVRARYDV